MFTFTRNPMTMCLPKQLIALAQIWNRDLGGVALGDALQMVSWFVTKIGNWKLPTGDILVCVEESKLYQHNVFFFFREKCSLVSTQGRYAAVTYFSRTRPVFVKASPWLHTRDGRLFFINLMPIDDYNYKMIWLIMLDDVHISSLDEALPKHIRDLVGLCERKLWNSLWR